MNYYIQGNKEKADQIKAAFGKYVSTQEMAEYDFSQEEYLFYTGQEERGTFVYAAWSDSVIAEIIKTHPDYKELKLPVAPKFKVGDKVIYNGKQHTVTFVNDKYYGFSGGVAGCRIELQDQLLSPAPKPHYNISNFKPFDKVLVRDDDNECWMPSLFGWFDSGLQDGKFVCGTSDWEQCIPFEGNEHLLGTIDMCDEMYINW